MHNDIADALTPAEFQYCLLYTSQTRELLDALRALSYDEAKALWKCSDALTELNYERVMHMDVEAAESCTPAVFSYEGIQYQNMACLLYTSDRFFIATEAPARTSFAGAGCAVDGAGDRRIAL